MHRFICCRKKLQLIEQCVSLIGSRTRYASVDYTLAYCVKLFVRSLAQFKVGCFAIALRLTVAQCFYPRCHILLACIVGSVAFEEHGLNNDVPFEPFEVLNDFPDIVRRLHRTVNTPYVFVVDRVEFQDVIVNFHQGFPYIFPSRKG